MLQNDGPVTSVEHDRAVILDELHNRRESKTARRKTLYKTLWEDYHVRGRWDSRLCQKYVMGEDIDIRLIAAALKEMTFYSHKTNYPSYIKILQCHHRKFCCDSGDNDELLKNQMSSYAKYAVACNLAVADMHICSENHCIRNDLKAYHTIWTPPVPQIESLSRNSHCVQRPTTE